MDAMFSQKDIISRLHLLAPPPSSFVLCLPFFFPPPLLLAQEQFENPKFPPPSHERQQPQVERKLKIFDTLDFDVFSNQKWDRLGESHATDVIVTWPDGHETRGIQKHIEDLKAL